MLCSISIELDNIFTDDDASIAFVYQLFSFDAVARNEVESLLDSAKQSCLDEISSRLLKVASLPEASQDIRRNATVLLADCLLMILLLQCSFNSRRKQKKRLKRSY
ncbi:hypothetical protein CCACVL1_30854 [Corchorus capsularis]|uniref:Armadillo-like helical n=1 Tax=Corchorus capsularis TaxID=210143 RepID=A0A1R3FUZ8_COCAP|nr:hypothetical protein CCACVL1_30854 [Corchorus capsularis]